MNNIEFNFRKARQQADSLEEMANHLERLGKQDFQDIMQNLFTHWEGENAVAYLQKGTRVEEELIQTAAQMKKTADNLRKTAKKLYDAEKFAQQKAQKRTYHGGGGASGGGGSSRSW